MVIHDAFSHIPSKTARWRLRNIAKGLCDRCGKRKPKKNHRHCITCLKAKKTQHLKRYTPKPPRTTLRIGHSKYLNELPNQIPL